MKNTTDQCVILPEGNAMDQWAWLRKFCDLNIVCRHEKLTFTVREPVTSSPVITVSELLEQYRAGLFGAPRLQIIPCEFPLPANMQHRVRIKKPPYGYFMSDGQLHQERRPWVSQPSRF